MNYLDTSIEYVKGVGPQRAELLKKELGIFTLEDLLSHYPFRYVDKSKFWKVREVKDSEIHVQVRGQFSRVNEVGSGRGARLVAKFRDETGDIELVWFKGIKWIKQKLAYGKTYIVYGKPALYAGKWTITHPDFEEETPAIQNLGAALTPVYSATEKLNARGLGTKGLERLIKTVLPEAISKINETIPDEILEKYRLPGLAQCIREIHAPSGERALKIATQRLKFEELLHLQLILCKTKLENTKKIKGFVFEKVGDHFSTFYDEHLPFELTGAQKRVLKEIRIDAGSGAQMNRMIQGDVGSGKNYGRIVSFSVSH